MSDRTKEAHQAAWPDMFQSLQEAYAELSRTEQELERKASQIQETRDLFLQVIESMSEAFVLLDVSGRVRRANQAAGRLFEAQPEELENEPFSEICGNPDIPATPWEIAEKRKEGIEPTDFDAEVVTRSGERVPVLVSCSAVRDEGESIRGVLIMIRDMTERKAAQDQIRESLRQKEALLQELHHRVKNNLQLVSSLLRLQSRKVDDPGTRAALRDSRGRITALTRLHERLYNTEDMESVDFGAYVRGLSRELMGAMGSGSVRIDVEVEEVEVGLNTAIPCGLIVNELVTNSLEHAFPDERTGEIRVRVAKTSDGGIRVVVSDDGVGLDEETDAAESGSLGMSLIETLARQVDGEVTYEAGAGTRVELTVPASEISGPPP